MVNTNTEEHKSCCLDVVQEQGFEKKKKYWPFNMLWQTRPK